MKLVFASAFESHFSICRDSIVVSTLRCGRNNPGSNPGHGTFFFSFQKLTLGQHMLPFFFFLAKKLGSSGI